MKKEQEELFWKTIRALDELGILNHIMIIGSWAEYLFPALFETDFIPNLKTRDVDFFWFNHTKKVIEPYFLDLQKSS